MLSMIDTKNDIVEQLCDIYYKYETWHEFRLTREEAYKYHKKMLDNGNIITYYDTYSKGVNVLGYVEFWRINYEQFGRIICHADFNSYLENVTDGNIAYVANTWIHPDYRNSKVVKMLKYIFFRNCYICDYYCGSALRKKTQPVKVLKRADLKSKLFKEGEL